MIDKKALRAELRARRDAHMLALHDRGRAAADAVAARLDEALSGVIGGYVGLGGEFPVTLDRVGALPVVTGMAEPMVFHRWYPGDPLAEGWKGLMQPLSGQEIVPDVILTPLVGFDRTLGRIGQGAGHYDRWFAAHPEALRIGVAWACQEVDNVPRDPWDMPLHAIVTELEWIGPTP